MTRSHRTANEIEDDASIGLRIKLQRQHLGMSQSALADQLGITFQQVQKYESGANRVGGSRMAQIAEILGVDPGYFFGREVKGRLQEANYLTFLAIRGATELLAAYAAMTSRQREAFLLLATRITPHARK